MCLFGKKNKISVYTSFDYTNNSYYFLGELIEIDEPFDIMSSRKFKLFYEKNIDNKIMFEDTSNGYYVNFIYITKKD